MQVSHSDRKGLVTDKVDSFSSSRLDNEFLFSLVAAWRLGSKWLILGFHKLFFLREVGQTSSHAEFDVPSAAG